MAGNSESTSNRCFLTCEVKFRSLTMYEVIAIKAPKVAVRSNDLLTRREIRAVKIPIEVEISSCLLRNFSKSFSLVRPISISRSYTFTRSREREISFCNSVRGLLLRVNQKAPAAAKRPGIKIVTLMLHQIRAASQVIVPTYSSRYRRLPSLKHQK